MHVTKRVGGSVLQQASVVHRARARSLKMRAMASLTHGNTFFLDEFALRQWDDPNFAGKLFQSYSERCRQTTHP